MSKRKTNIYYLTILIASLMIFSSCATIIGGTNYYAKVQVPNHKDARIEYQGSFKGTGEAVFKAKRKDADKFAVTIKKEDCETQTKLFTQKSFRGWAFVGSLLGWTGLIPLGESYIPLPWGIAVDGTTGAWWKPDINENGVSKQDYDHFTYQIDYTGCDYNLPSTIQKNNSSNSSDKLRDLKNLLDEGIITKEEFETEKKKILDKQQ